jgi:hypothetical protein
MCAAISATRQFSSKKTAVRAAHYQQLASHLFMCEKQQLPSAEAEADPVAKFCDELATPLEIVSNLLHIATLENVGAEQSKDCANLANEKLDDVRGLVIEHCSRNDTEAALPSSKPVGEDAA